jgi:PAS domain S-box-containing protein/putative nucleotidyltransferase with HDIG domain
MLNTESNSNQITGELEGLRQRVTELEKINAGYLRERESLLRAEERLRSVLDNTFDVVFQLSPTGIIQYVSPRVKDVYGYEPQDLVGNHFKKTTPLSELPRALKALALAFSGKEIVNFEINQMSIAGKIISMEINATPVKQNGQIVAVQGIMRDISLRKRAEADANTSTEKLVVALESTISAMAMIVEMRDPYTAGHQRRVTQLASAIAREIGLPDEQITGLRLAGLIHDIGKVRVPVEILANPESLSEAEFGIIKMHPALGYEILSTIELPWPVADIIHQHHERLNGSGYPSGLKAKEILIESRILAVADVVEAISCPRPYRPALGIEKALDEINKNRGVLYDENIVETCLKLFHERGFSFQQGPTQEAFFK